MQIMESIKLAFGAIASNKVRSTLTMLGIIIGVSSVILLVSLGEGARLYISNEFANLGTNTIIVTPGKSETTGALPTVGSSKHNLTLTDADAIENRCRGVRGVAPLILGAGYVKYENRRRDTTVLGVTHTFPEVRNVYPAIGAFISERDENSKRKVVAIGYTVKKELFGNESPLGKYVSVGGSKHQVIAVMERKGLSLGIDMDDVVFIPLDSAQQLFNTDKLFEILVAADRKSAVPFYISQIRDILIEMHDGDEDFTVTDQDSLLSSFTMILTMLTYMLAAIAGISLLVGGIGIMNIMLVSVSERTMEIGLRKAVGARNSDIMTQFLIEALLLSIIGGLIGIALGFISAWSITFIFPSLPLNIPLWSIELAFLFANLVGIFFGVYPASRAAQFDPVEALRYE